MVASCEGAATSAPASTAELQAKLSQRFPDVRVEAIHPAPIAGLFEIVTATGISYADASGEHLILGRIMETASKRDLTSDAWDRYNVIDFNALPLEHAIKTKHGEGTHKLALFSDPDCPYCQALEAELQKLPNVTIYTFLLPIERTHPGSTDKAKSIWCASNPNEAWRAWMIEKVSPTTSLCANNPIESIGRLATELKVTSTPTIFLSNGTRLTGLAQLADIQAALDRASAPVERDARATVSVAR